MKQPSVIGQIFRRAIRGIRPADLSAPGARRRVDHLVKMNLIPVFGRRDAAFDRVLELVRMEIFTLSPEERLQNFANIKRLLRRVKQDTRKILSILSNADTISRENKFLNFVMLLDYAADALESFAVFSNHLIQHRNDINNFSPLQSGIELVTREEDMIATEISLVNQLREFLERAEPRVNRYREYAAKSLSASYAERYTSSYGFYIRAFRGEDPTADSADGTAEMF